ncbi:TetR/AcrR family transcriptional regulator [Pseudonocardia sp. DSM 110487]|uniref:TetR/AcrR family transcriptional regulator n=1 Tax=Pseudonocardia sp. DSM 110487 TaxID=2865833 RepID=UPI001C69AD37|nr:TetR/AcrR family transcriptional regulator [Pseudonocardia sp. DSM 110487]QYN32929.1 TetR/AcrR family transcriptional regulator [Pseudonocardia sp. DSM 110487]
MDSEVRPARRRLRAEDRRQQIVETAFTMVAEKGFEGLRTRDVAAHAGINSATLHHYFPTKEALVEGVAAHLEARYRHRRSPELATDEGAPAAVRRLRQEFADVAFFWREDQRTWAVSREFMLRAPRDEAVADLVTRLNERWCAGVERVLAEGRDAGVFRGGLDPAAAALAVVGALWGSIVLTRPTQERFAAVCREIEAGLTGEKK